MTAIKFTDALNAAKALLNAYQAWQSQEGPHVPYDGAMVKGISERLDRVIRQACDNTADCGDPVDEKARPFVLIFDDLAVAFLKWIQDASMQLPTAPPRGSTDLHNAIDRMAKLFESHNYPKPVPLKQLLEIQMVSPRQVAIIYGWKLPDGSPDVTKVFEEQASPGTHYNSETWVHPARKAIEAEFTKEWAQREPRSVMFRQLDEKPSSKPNVPTLDELFAANAPKAQIMRLHRLSEEEIEIIAQERGLSLVGERFIIPANETVAHQERMEAEAKMQAMIKESVTAPVAPTPPSPTKPTKPQLKAPATAAS